MKTEVTCHNYDCENNEKSICTSRWITLEPLKGREMVCENYEKKVSQKHGGETNR